jgi:hypothetical protein
MVASNSPALRSLPALCVAAAISVLLVAGCDSMTAVDHPMESHRAIAYESEGSESTSGYPASYDATLLSTSPETENSVQELFLALDESGSVFGTYRDRAARWTLDTAGNVAEPELLGALPAPFEGYRQYVHAASATGDIVVGHVGRPSVAAWVWTNGVMRLLPLPDGATQAYAVGIGEGAAITGSVYVATEDDWGSYAAVWLPPYDAGPILLPRTAHGEFPINRAHSITTTGVITGPAKGLTDVLVEWQIDSDGHVVSGPVQVEGSDGFYWWGPGVTGRVLDAAGHVNFSVAALFRLDRPGERIDLGMLGGHDVSIAHGTTGRADDGSIRIVGYSGLDRTLSSDQRAVLWAVDATGTVAGPLDVGLPSPYPTNKPDHRFVSARAHSVNSTGWIVGYSRRADGSFYATLWQPEAASDDTPPPATDGPTASFGYSCDSNRCQFTDTSTEGGAEIVSRDWISGTQAASGSQVSFTFGTAGDHVVTLTVTDADNASDQASRTIKCRDNRVHGLRCS